MPSVKWITGNQIKHTLQPYDDQGASQGSELEFYFMSADGSEKAELVVNTHTGSGGVQMRLATILDGNGQLTLGFNYSQKPGTTILITAGQRHIMREYYTVGGSNLLWAVPLIIEQVSRKMVINQQLVCTFSWQLDGQAGSYSRS